MRYTEMTKYTSIIQESGQVTLPAEFRKRYGLQKGDIVVFRETEEGLLVSPKETMVINLLDEIGEALKEKGVSLEELIETGREIRQEIYNQYYAKKTDE